MLIGREERSERTKYRKEQRGMCATIYLVSLMQTGRHWRAFVTGRYVADRDAIVEIVDGPPHVGIPLRL
jgi:hypothetical protein